VQERKNAFDNIFCFLIAFWAVLPRLSTAQKAQIFCRFLQNASYLAHFSARPGA